MNLKSRSFVYHTRLISLCFFICVCLSLSAQLNSGNLSQLTQKDGLSSNTVNAVLVDSLGYVWISTYNGLIRYNGYEFEKFYSNPNDSNAIRGMVVYALFQDRHRHIWVGSNPNFIEVFNPVTRSFKSYDYAKLVRTYAGNLQLGSPVSSICEDDKGRLYFGINTGAGEKLHTGLLYKDANEDTIKLFNAPDSLEVQNVSRLRKDQQGNIWILSRSGIFTIDTTGKLSRYIVSGRTPFQPNEFIVDFDITKEGDTWFLSNHARLFDGDIASGQYRIYASPFYPKNDPGWFANTLFITKPGVIWIGTRSEVQQFDPKTGTFRIFNSGTNKELEQVFVNDFAMDQFGGLYIATNSRGLLRYEEKPQFISFTSSGKASSILPGWADIICEASDGNTWVHTYLGLTVLDTRSKSIKAKYASNLYPVFAYITSLWENAPGEFYFGAGQGGVYSFSLKTGSIQKVSFPGLPRSSIVTRHLMDSRRNEWLATRTGLYRKSEQAGSFKNYDLSKLEGSDSTANGVSGIFESNRHGLWIITDNGLYLYHYDTDTISRPGYDKSKGDVFISQDINSLYEDNEGIVWVGQWQGGLARYIPETGKIKSFTTDDGLPSMGVQSIIGDEKNHKIWLSSFNGISQFDPATEQFINFSIDDGIQGSLFTDGCFLKTRTGMFIFGGANGITIFNPDGFNIHYVPPKVFLTDLKLFNQPVIPGKNSILKRPVYQTSRVILNHSQNNLTLGFAGIHYSNPAKNRIEYILENYDPEWREAGGRNEASYPNLPPGEYIFRVKAANDKGVWNEEGASLYITIHPPWWQTWWAYVLYGLLFVIFVLLVHRFQKERVIKAEREKVREKELAQAKEIEKAYHSLKSTQAQLIQSEKMASLGELTAGIAHEIQNPLNFVNNFSDVNSELIDEANQELDRGNTNEAKTILRDLKENEQKIIYHGKRADAIVKNMLLHSRGGSGVKEPTDINAMADEFLRLSFHGMRARDKSFNAKYETSFDNAVGKINIVQQEIGRVLLNLINNAFYAVNEKAKQNIAGYDPIVTVSTKKLNGKVEISVKDNGKGIPESIKEKIFQPFFTTKPTGQGTGLGLSLSYDIVKAHGGQIKTESNTNEGTALTILLPLNNNF